MTTIKRFLIVVTILTLGLNHVFAERVSQEDAASVANNFMNATPSGSGARKAPAKRMVLKKAPATSEEQQYYIYEDADGEGWVMVAANDIARPILAYSDEGQFRTDHQPANVKYWLGKYNKQIKEAEEKGVSATEEVAQEWKQLRKGIGVRKGTPVVSALIKTKWDQDAPYYNLCPKKGSTFTLTGCVATAMAQVMNYWQWPEKGTGSHSYSTETLGLSCSANFGATTYDWANMLDKYSQYYNEGSSSPISTSAGTTAQKNAVATLMYHCGVAVEMDYNISSAGGSGAQTVYPNASNENLRCAQNAFWNHFGYKKSTIKGYYRPGGYGYSAVSTTNWHNYLKAELDAARPIMYGGADEEGGHSFICDGYDNTTPTRKYHFNWGWSGYCDGYYDVDALVPGTGGSGAGNGSYNDDQDIIIGIVPDKPDITITWSVQGVTSTTTQTTGTLVLPASTPSDCSGSGGKKFVGWTEQSTISGGTRPSDLFTSGSGITVTGNKTYYAVYATASGSGGGSSSGTKTFNFSSIASANSWANGVAYTEVEDSPVTITAEGGGNNGKWYTSGGGSWRMYSGGTVIISVTGGNVTSVTSSPACTFTITDGEASYSPSARTDYTSITVNYTVSGGGTSYSDYSLTCSAPEPCSNQVNLTKGSPSNGTFSLDKANGAYDNCSAGGLVVTVSDITPAEGYEFGAITQTGIASGVTIDQAGKAVTYAKDVTGSSTINVTFTPKTTYAIRFFNNGEQVGATQNLYAGQTAVKPSPDPTACTGYTFVGWWTAALATNNTTSETWVTDFTVTGAQDYYAVYSRTTGGGGSSSGTKTFSFSSIASSEGWANGVAYTEVEDSPVTITAEGGGNNGKWYTSGGGSWRMYSGGTVIITVSGGEVTSVTSSPACTFTITNGEASYSPSARTDYTSISVNYTVSGGGTTYYTTTAECDECINKVTLEKGTPSNGTFSLDKANGAYDNCSAGGLVVTVSDITPADGYEFGAITQTGIASGVTIDQAGKAVTYAKDVTGSSTINVTFTPKTTYAIRFFNNGEQVGATQNLYEGQSAVKPSDPSACEGYTFVGWWTAALATDNTTAETWVTDFTVTGAQDYYAVYSRTTGGGGSSSGTKTFSFSSIASSEGWANGVAYTEVEDSPVTITAEGGGNNGKWYTSGGGSWRMYSGGTVIITVSGGEVTSVTSSPASTFTIADGEAFYSPSARTDYTSITVNYTVSGGGTTYYTTTAECVECTNKVTLTKGSSSNGTFALDKADGEYENCAVGGLVVHVTDITQSEDYQFKEITQTGIATGVTIDQAGKTVTYAKDVAGTSTINVIFEPKPSYTIRFYNGESLIGTAQTVVSGKTPSVPSNPEACEGYTFVGWWTETLAANNTETHTWVTDFTATGNRDYYAIYRHNEGGSGSGTESVTFSDIYTSNTIVEDISIAIGTHTSVTFTKGGSDTQYYTNGDAIRWYGGGTCVVASDAGNITGITFTFGSSDGNNMIEADGYEEPTWTGEASSVTFAQSGSSGHRRIAGISVTIDGGGTAHYTSVFSCSGHMITVESVEHGSGASESRCDEGGTVTITLTADEGYDCGGITTSPVVSVTKTAECTYTFTMPNEDINVTPDFTLKTPRTFTFVPGTGTCATTSMTEAVWHGGVTLPVATANSGCDPEYVFAGWATSAVTVETEVRPTLYAAGTLYNGEETTLYAVYSQTTGGSASGFTLSYTIDDVTYYAAARTGTNKYMGATTDVADAARFTIVTSNDKQYLCWHGENDTYVSNNSNKTDLLFSTNIENAYSWDITETGNTIALAASSGRHFMFNTNIAQRDRFAAYSTDDVLVKGDAGTTVYNSIPSCVCYSVDITYNANGGTLAEGCENVTGGECERDWLLCDAPTREGYLFTNWKDQNGTLYDAGAIVTDLKISLTLTAQWIPAPYTVLFNAGSGSCVESLTESSRGDGIILPKAEPSPACADDWTFIGWSETVLVGETNTTASIIGVAGTPYTPASNNVTLYAVYSSLDEGGATDDYTRENASTPEEGDYAILVAKSDDSFGLLTYGTTSSGRLAYTEAYNSLQTTISSPAATQIWHLSYDVDGYAYLYNANAGAYLAASGTNITYNANAGSAFVLTRDPGDYGDYKCLNNTASGSTNYYLGANKDYDFIRYYTSQTLAALNSITLYKGSIGTRYYATSPVCTACEDPEWSFEMGTSVTKTKGSEPFTNTVVKGHESLGTVTYSSTNEAVATVDATGLVTMHETGTTTITLRLTKAMPYCAAVLQYELEVKEPSIDIVGVTPDGEIILEHDLEGTITLDLSEGNAISTGTAANDLFFSKYFEAASNMKLFAIFNGTGHEMDLSNIRVRCNCTTDGKWPKKTGDLGYVELRTISKLREQYPKLKIPSGTELIFWSNNTTTAPEGNSKLRNCISVKIGDMTYTYSDMEAMEIPNWFCLGNHTTYNVIDADGNNQFIFNGDDSMILERYNPATGQWEAIDIFGAGTSAAPASTAGLVEKITTNYEINGSLQPLNDDPGFHALCEGSTIPLSTNRYMLVRKNTVLDGMNAVALNATSFATLCEEWHGTRVGGAKDDAAFCHSGEIFSDIAEYDYAENYIDWDEITDDKYDVDENEDGTVSVTFTGGQDLDARACSLLKIEVHDKDDASNILATTEYKIPIVVKAGDVMTTAELFYSQADKCATCDVAILGSAVLTKATDGVTNDMPEVRDIYVYGGGKLVIPSGTHYRARDLIMRMQMADDEVNVEVPNVRVDGSLTNQYGGSIRQQVRVGTSRFYQFAVPYPVRLEDVTFSDGTPAVYGEDFMIRYYDGEQRAINLGTISNWRNYEGTELYPGIGYTLAVAKKAGHEQRELIFPMADASLEAGEPATKGTTIHAWGDNTIRANHRGWNFLSNPYLTTYAETNLYGDASSMLTTGQLVPDPEHPGWWVNSGDNIPYVTLINSTRTDYSQDRVEYQALSPFTTFFVQVGDDDHNSGEEFSLTFDRAHRAALSAPSYIRAAQKTPVARFGVLLSGNGAEDNCGVVVGEKYSAAYDMQADLSKEFGSAYSLKLYSLQEDKMQMAFLATHPDSLSQPIPLGVRLPANGEYTFSIDRRYNLGAFAHIYLTDNLTGQHTDLLDDTYTFTGSRQQNDARFSLSVEMQKETPTDIQHLLNGVYAVGRDGSLLLTGMPETADIYIYDMGGRMVHSGHTQGATSVTYPLPTGVYQIRVLSEGANALLRTIVY